MTEAKKNNPKVAEKNISDEEELFEKVVHVNRCAKVVKGGRRFGFAAIMIVGDNKGRVGYGTGKAKEVPEAVRKATENAKNRMIRDKIPKRGFPVTNPTYPMRVGPTMAANFPNIL